MQKFKTLDEINQLVRLLQSEPEIKNKVNHYESVIKSSDKLVKAIEERLANTTDNYEAAKLELEKIDAEQKVFNSTQYYQIWSHRAVDFDIRYKEVVADCDANYDTIIAEGEVVRKKNPILDMIMGKHSELENVDNRLRVEFYLAVRQAVENHKKHYGIKGSLI
jgi:vacuolar-type H+-ATPase subunit I/STV1